MSSESQTETTNDHGASLAAVDEARSASEGDAAAVRHTPGPWVADRDGIEYSIYAASINDYIADVWDEANAHLIAAAPELYEALKGMLDQPETPEAYDAMMDRAQRALAKAEGKCRVISERHRVRAQRAVTA